MSPRILVVDDAMDFLETIRRSLRMAGFREVRIESDPRKAAEAFGEGARFDLALLDVTMPGLSGLELLRSIRSASPETECIMISAVNQVETAVSCIRGGAYDYLLKPISPGDLVGAVRRALERKRLIEVANVGKRPIRLRRPEAFRAIVAETEPMRRILREAELHAASDVPVLITGATGTGKELLARAVHQASPRSERPFVPVNMAVLSDGLFNAEFFGHTRGAFTGAESARAGYLEAADGGTLFLDEIGSMPPEVQGSLLRVFQEGEVFRLGSNRPLRVDLRFVAATNVDLEAAVRRGVFRKDLYYRLRGAWLHLPDLKDRRADIPPLLDHFAARLGVALDPETRERLLSADFPGNVRELQSVVTAAANLARDGVLTPHCLPPDYRRRRPARLAPPPSSEGETIPTLAMVERDHILKIYHRLDRNKSRTARELGISINTLRKKLSAYGAS